MKANRKSLSVFNSHALLPLVLYTLFSFSITIQQSYAFEGESSQCKEMKISPDQMAQSPKTEQRGNTPNSAVNAADNNFSSVWSNKGSSAEWIKVDLGQQKVLCYIDISWMHGERRTNDFEIYVLTHSSTMLQSSADDILWHSGSSSGRESMSPATFERVAIDDVVARFVKIVVYGNQWNNWTAIKELRIHGYDLPEGDNSKFLIATLRTHVENQQELVDLYADHLETPSDISLSKPDDSNLGYTMQLAGQHGVSYFSVEEIERNVERLKASGIDVIEYNLEESYSPRSDLRDPVLAVQKAYDIAHKNGLKLILTPSMHLTKAHVSEFAQSTDYYNIMALELQTTGQYAAFYDHVVSVVEKIREQSPNLAITAELTTVRGSIEDMMKNCIATLPHVDGYSIWYSNDSDGLDKLEHFLDWFDGLHDPA